MRHAVWFPKVQECLPTAIVLCVGCSLIGSRAEHFFECIAIWLGEMVGAIWLGEMG